MSSNKDIRVTIRLTLEQYESITTRAETAMMAPSAYVRAAAMRHKVTAVPGLDEITHELKGIGRNLNQLTVLANMGKIKLVYLMETYEQLGKLLQKLCELAEMESR